MCLVRQEGGEWVKQSTFIKHLLLSGLVPLGDAAPAGWVPALPPATPWFVASPPAPSHSFLTGTFISYRL